MIWKFHFSRSSLVWILCGSLVLGLGFHVAEYFGNHVALPTGLVTGTPEATKMKQLADSIMTARVEKLLKPIDINLATAQELDRLDGIGRVLSNRIVEYREANGPFKSVKDLENVSGIGPKKLEAIKDKCIISEVNDSTLVMSK